MLPPRYRLRSSAQISQAIRHGRRARRGAVVVHVQLDEGGHSPAQAAFAVSKAVGDSVTRHRVVRRLRAFMPPLLDRLPAGTAVVVRAMPEAATVPSSELQEDLLGALERVVPMAPPPTQEPTLQSPSRGILWWIGWPVRSLLIGLVWVYRHTVSPILPPTCRYHPSCSAYGLRALQVHGAVKGTALTAWRVLRCNPFTEGGLDPVPPRGAWRPEIHPDGTPRVATGPTA